MFSLACASCYLDFFCFLEGLGTVELAPDSPVKHPIKTIAACHPWLVPSAQYLDDRQRS